MPIIAIIVKDPAQIRKNFSISSIARPPFIFLEYQKSFLNILIYYNNNLIKVNIGKYNFGF